MRTIVIGDIHGTYKALLQCFERSGFNRIKDRLIVIGDVCDGYPDVRQCIDEFLKVKHCGHWIGRFAETSQRYGQVRAAIGRSHHMGTGLCRRRTSIF